MTPIHPDSAPLDLRLLRVGDPEDEGNPVRGLFFGIVFAVPLWVGIAWVCSWWVQG